MHKYAITYTRARFNESGEPDIVKWHIGHEEAQRGSDVLTGILDYLVEIGDVKPGTDYHIDKTRNEMSISGVGVFKVKRVKR